MYFRRDPCKLCQHGRYLLFVMNNDFKMINNKRTRTELFYSSFILKMFVSLSNFTGRFNLILPSSTVYVSTTYCKYYFSHADKFQNFYSTYTLTYMSAVKAFKIIFKDCKTHPGKRYNLKVNWTPRVTCARV